MVSDEDIVYTMWLEIYALIFWIKFCEYLLKNIIIFISLFKISKNLNKHGFFNVSKPKESSSSWCSME